jgi:hypothetical protein
MLISALSASLVAAPHADAALIPSTDGLTVLDTDLYVTWLANANLPATEKLGVSNINADGSMTFATAVEWVNALNSMNGGAGYLGRNNWTIPTTPVNDSTCRATGPSGNFGFSCTKSAMGSLYYLSLGLNYPNSAVSIPDYTVGPFTNFQPYLYWSDTANVDSSKGYRTFSFNSGWQGSNVDRHYMYALPMIAGRLPGTYYPTGVNGLQISADGQTVYDPNPAGDVTWLANANLAMTQDFGAQCVNGDGTPCINADGSMSHTTAEDWIIGMNGYNGGAGWLGQSHWQLPPTVNPDASCSLSFDCTGSPMGELFYSQLGLSAGDPVVPTPDSANGPFNNIQPYLYWSCGVPNTLPICQAPPPAPGFQWSFSFGNGFEGTDLTGNNLYLMVYSPDRIFSDGFEQ